ncbi:MAG: hypothetical protein IJ083_17915, partial [Clostridia bacterium]|nr:hypothetical protein [Clostridia bacterium]
MSELPRAFVERMKQKLGDEIQEFMQAYDQPPVRGIRLNSQKKLAGNLFEKDLGERIPWEAQGFELSAASRLGASPFHEGGAFYLQEPSAMFPVAVLNPQENEWI